METSRFDVLEKRCEKPNSYSVACSGFSSGFPLGATQLKSSGPAAGFGCSLPSTRTGGKNKSSASSGERNPVPTEKRATLEVPISWLRPSRQFSVLPKVE